MGAEDHRTAPAGAGPVLRELRRVIARFQPGAGGEDVRSSLSDRASRLYKSRRARAASFRGNDDLFGEPAWDILLDLFIAAEAGRRVSVSSACIAASVPATTALRWLAALEQRGLVERLADPADARRIHVQLSATAIAAMKQWLEFWA